MPISGVESGMGSASVHSHSIPHVCVLMSTYNGECYLKEQIESILQQKGVKVNLIVRDDGSKDYTNALLKRYAAQGALTIMESSENLGFAMSFMTLLAEAPLSDYYAFSDQDDVWQPDKLLVGITALQKMSGTARLYSSNLSVWRDGVVEREKYEKKPRFSAESTLNRSICFGCTCVFNEALRSLVLAHWNKRIYPIHAHDLWLFHTAMFLGDYHFDPTSYIFYRQHGSNQIGAKNRWTDRLRSRIRSLRTLSHQHEREQEAQNLLACYGDLLSASQKQEVERVAQYRNGIVNRLALLFNKNINLSMFDALRIIIGAY